jgi:hypothetical protein
MTCKHEDGCIECLREEVQTLQTERNYLRGVLGKTLEGLQAAQGASNLGPPIPRVAVAGSREAANAAEHVRNEAAKLLSIPEVARLWGRRVNVVYYACDKGLIHHLKNNEGKIRIRQDVALAYMETLKGARSSKPQAKKTFTVAQAAKVLDTSIRQVYRACESGGLSFTKNPKGVMVISESALLRQLPKE